MVSNPRQLWVEPGVCVGAPRDAQPSKPQWTPEVPPTPPNFGSVQPPSAVHESDVPQNRIRRPHLRYNDSSCQTAIHRCPASWDSHGRVDKGHFCRGDTSGVTTRPFLKARILSFYQNPKGQNLLCKYGYHLLRKTLPRKCTSYPAGRTRCVFRSIARIEDQLGVAGPACPPSSHY